MSDGVYLPMPRREVAAEEVPISGGAAGDVTYYPIVVLRDDQVERIADVVVARLKAMGIGT
jgi:hypothetical protein